MARRRALDSAVSLTPKQEAFVLNYVACLNATEAARNAGYQSDSDITLAAIGYENLRKPHIRARIDEILDQQTLSDKEIIGRLAAQARGDMGDFIDPDSGVVKLRRARELGLTHLIKKVKIKTTVYDDKEIHEQEFELYDSQAALVHLGKARGMFKERVQVDDWHSQAIEDIKAGRLDYKVMCELFDTDLATELFRLAGVPVE